MRLTAWLAILSAALALAGCAPLQSDRLADEGGLPTAALNLQEMPFFPQAAYQCGPAALATVLRWTEASVDPDALVPQVFLPAREGSLQPEVTAAARRYGRVPYPLAPEMSDLFAELQAGHPVLVLQNLGLALFPQWHYAVVVGYDPGARQVILRSGETRERAHRLTTFERTWRRAEYWALVVLPPDQLPATAEPRPYLAAATALDAERHPEALISALSAARAAWPDEPATHLALGNAYYETGAFEQAADALRQGADHHPGHAALHHNLAVALLALDELEAARAAAEYAIGLGGPWADRAATLRDRIEKRRQKSPPGDDP